MSDRQVRFLNSIGYSLAGTIRWPDKPPPHPAVIFSHGFQSGKDSPRNVPIADRLLEAGLAVFLVDFTGHGESEGSLDESTVEQQVDDLTSALMFLTGQGDIDPERVGINGSSSGAMVAGHVALDFPAVRALVFRAPRFDHLIREAPKITAPTRIIQGDRDPLLRPQTIPFYEALTCEKDLAVIRGGTHLFEDPEHFAQVVTLTADWFEDQLLNRPAQAA